jgi:CheY-like chemotaxis protein
MQPNKYHVLLIDLEMPEKDGYETVSEIRAKDAQIPIIAFTAAVYDNMQADLTSKGFSDYIQKPFRPEDLHRKLAKYVQN